MILWGVRDMKKVFLLLLAICLIGTVALTAGCGQSGTSDGKSSGQKVLRVGMDASYPPFGSQNQETKDYEGFDVDIIRAIGEAEGFDVEISNRSFDGLIPALQAKEIDVAINDITITDDRKQSVDFSKPYYIAGLGVVTRADNDTIHTAEDLQGKASASRLARQARRPRARSPAPMCAYSMPSMRRSSRYRTAASMLLSTISRRMSTM